jgi:hypothetical protein
MTVREQLAEAASTVDGVTVTPYYVGANGPGRGFIRLDRVDYPNRFGGVARWNVVLHVPDDITKAEQWVEAKAPLVRDALAEHLVVTSVVPGRIDLLGVGVFPCLFINGHREED